MALANTSLTVPNTQLLPGQTVFKPQLCWEHMCKCASATPHYPQGGMCTLVSVHSVGSSCYAWWLPAPPPYWWNLAQTLGTDSRAHLGIPRGCLNRLLSQHYESQQLSTQTCKTQPQNSPRRGNSFVTAAPSVLTIMIKINIPIPYFYYLSC